MSYRFTLAAVAAVFALTGCAKQATVAQPDFTSGATLVTVTHVPTKTDDGTQVYVTIDGSEAGALPTGDSIDVRLPAGKHKIGGYARSLIGKVTIPAIDVTTSPTDINHVTYSIAKLKPTFTLGKATPVPPIPQPDPVPSAKPDMPIEQSKIETQVVPAVPQQIQAETPADPVTAEKTPATTESTTTPAQPAATSSNTTAPVTTVQQSQTDTSSSAPQAVNVTNLTDTPQA